MSSHLMRAVYGMDRKKILKHDTNHLKTKNYRHLMQAAVICELIETQFLPYGKYGHTA
jgi:hypothetical protein